MANVETKAENPFVSLTNKKCRNLKKKLDRIVKIEEKQREGKLLQAEEVEALNTKNSLERLYNELKSLREQFEEVAKQAPETPVPAPDVKSVEEPEPEPVKEEPVLEEIKVTEQTTSSTQYEVEAEQQEPEVTTSAPVVEEAPSQPAPVSIDVQLKKILKALHVYQRYKDVTARALPESVDFFGKTLLGLTSITPFPDTLNSSVRVANLYLDAEAGAQLEIVRGLTYGQMDNWIDQLAEEMERLHVRGATSSLTALLRNSITPTPVQQHVEPLITPAYTPAAPQPTQAFQLNVEASYAAPHHGLQFSEEAFRGLDFGYQSEPLYYSAPVAAGVAPVVPVGVGAAPSSLPVAPALDDVIPAPETAFESVPEAAAQSIAADSSDHVPTDVAVVGEEGAVGGRGGGRTRRAPRGRGGRGEDGERRERIQRDRKPRRDVAPKSEEGKDDALAAAPVEGDVKHRPEGGRGRGGRGKPFRERTPRQPATVESGAPVEVASSSSVAPVAVEEAAPAPVTVKESKRWDREFKRKHEESKAVVPVEEKKEVKDVVAPVEAATPSVPESVAAAPVTEVKAVVEAAPAPTPAPAPKVEPKKTSWKEVGRALATPAESAETASSPATSAPEKAAVSAESAEQSGEVSAGPKGPRRDRKPRPPYNGEKGEIKERGDRPFREHRHPRGEGEGKEGEHKPYHHRGPRPVKAGEKTVNSDGAVSRPHPPRPAPVAAAK